MAKLGKSRGSSSTRARTSESRSPCGKTGSPPFTIVLVDVPAETRVKVPIEPEKVDATGFDD
jgi:hypothetical protein